jgi:predicted RNase H-like HicB family nuclease
LEIGPEGTGAFAPGYPGCWVFGRTPERALKKVETAIAEWLEWTAKHGEKTPEEMENFAMEAVETMHVDYNPVEAGKPEPLFWSEVASITRKDIARTLRLMKYSREDLLSHVSDLSPECLEWLPPGEPRTIRNCLRHIAYVEPWYVTRLNIDLPSHYPRDVFKLLDSSRSIVVDCLESFPREKMRGVFQPLKDKSPRCDLWTARKVLRRLVDHERLHAKYIERVVRLYEEKHG